MIDRTVTLTRPFTARYQTACPLCDQPIAAGDRTVSTVGGPTKLTVHGGCVPPTASGGMYRCPHCLADTVPVYGPYEPPNYRTRPVTGYLCAAACGASRQPTMIGRNA